MESQENRDQAQEVNESAAIEETKEVSAAQFLADALDSSDDDDVVVEDEVKTPEVTKEDESGKQEKDTKEAEAKEAGDVGDRKEEEIVPQRDEELAELRAMLRDARKEIAMLKAGKQTSDKTLKVLQERKESSDLLDDDEVKKEEKVEPTRLEALNDEIKVIARARGENLRTIRTVMKYTPEYKDIDEVVSQTHFDDIVEAIAKEYSKDAGVDLAEAILEVEASIWKLDNPYEFMYSNIKQYHPKYAKAGNKAKEEEVKEAAKEVPPRERKPAEAPTSIMNVGSGNAAEKSGWTSAMIDNLPEYELDRVPKDVYARYMQGDLP